MPITHLLLAPKPIPDSACALHTSGPGQNAPMVNLGSLGGGGGTSSPRFLDVAMSPEGGMFTLPLPDQVGWSFYYLEHSFHNEYVAALLSCFFHTALPCQLPTSTPGILAAALRHAGLVGGTIGGSTVGTAPPDKV